MRRISQARALCQSAGLAEDRVWQRLRAGRVDGHKFRRQHPVGRFIADFACERLRLILELDGGVHALEAVAERDAVRQAALEALGWTVIRFDNATALVEPGRIDAAIRAHARTVGI
jgi:very-short-patch-repair endonuclease